MSSHSQSIHASTQPAPFPLTDEPRCALCGGLRDQRRYLAVGGCPRELCLDMFHGELSISEPNYIDEAQR